MPLFWQILFVAWYCFITIFCEFATTVVQKYHRDKPLGMQSLHGKIIEEVLMPALQISAFLINIALVAVDGFGTVSYHMAVLLQLTDFFCISTFQLSLFAVLLTKYLTIYYGSLIDSLEDNQIILVVKVAAFGLPWIFMLIQYVFLMNIDQSILFQLKNLGYTTSGSQMETMIIFGNVINFVMILISQIRIEYDHIKRQEAQGLLANVKRIFSSQESGENDNLTENLGYQLSVLRILFACGVVFMTVVYFHATSGTESGKINSLIMATIISCIGPTVFIANHDGMRKIAVKQFKNICYFIMCYNYRI